jgi:ribosomal protein S27AE
MPIGDQDPMNKIKTCIIDKGQQTEQKIIDTYGEFEDNSFCTLNYKILPFSEKYDTSEDLENLKEYCPKCGKKVKESDNFCRKCGKKL